MKVRDLVKKLIEYNMDAEVSIETDFRGSLDEDEEVGIRAVEPAVSTNGMCIIIVIERP